LMLRQAQHDKVDDTAHASTPLMLRLRSCFDSAHASTPLMLRLRSCFDSAHASTPLSMTRGYYCGFRPSRARLSSSTLTRGAPRNPNVRPCTWRATSEFTAAIVIRRALATRGASQ